MRDPLATVDRQSPSTSDLGQKRKSRPVMMRSASPPNSDIGSGAAHVCFVPEADLTQRTKTARSGEAQEAWLGGGSSEPELPLPRAYPFSVGSLAMFAAIRLVSSLVNRFAAVRRPNEADRDPLRLVAGVRGTFRAVATRPKTRMYWRIVSRMRRRYLVACSQRAIARIPPINPSAQFRRE
jgi:hypothetical protein